MEIGDKIIVDFLAKNKIGVLSILLKDGSPHGATIHFSETKNPLKLFFLTNTAYRKCEALLAGDSVRASFVTGVSDEERVTFQADGEIRIVSGEEEKRAKEIHFEKNPRTRKYENDEGTVFLEFTPRWWRYTDFSVFPKKVLSSET